MFGHKGWVIVLRVKELLQSAESIVPTKYVPEEVKQPMIPKRDVGGRGMAVTFGLERLKRVKMRESHKTVGEAADGGCQFDPGGTHNQCFPKQSGKVLFSSCYAEVNV